MDSLSNGYFTMLERALDTLFSTIDIEHLTKPQLVNCLGYLNRLEQQMSSENDWPKYLTIRARLDKRLNEIDSKEE